MSLLNRFFGNKISTAKEIIKDEAKKEKLWQKHLKTTREIQILSGQFPFEKFETVLNNFEALKETLTKIRELITTELVTIKTEEEVEQETIQDVQSFHSTRAEIEIITQDLIKKQTEGTFHELFTKLCENWIASIQLIDKLCAISAIANDKVKSEARELLRQLRWRLKIIDDLHVIFDKEQYSKKDKHAKIMELAKKIIFGEKIKEQLKEELISDEEKFVNDMTVKMGDTESRGGYRTLGKAIYLKLTEIVGAPMEDIEKGMKKMERVMKDDAKMLEIVKELRPKLTPDKLKIIILAFRKAYDFGHFDDLASAFAT